MAQDATIRLVLDTQQFLTQVKNLDKELAKALTKEAGTKDLQARQKVLADNTKEIREQAGENAKNVDSWQQSLEVIEKARNELLESKKIVDELTPKKGLDTAFSQNKKGVYSPETVAKATERLAELHKHEDIVAEKQRIINEEVAKLPTSLENMPKYAEALARAYRTQVPAAKVLTNDIEEQERATKKKAELESQLTPKTKETTKATEQSAKASKKAADATEQQVKATQKLADTSSKIVDKPKKVKDTATTPKPSGTTEKVSDTDKQKNALKNIVKEIYTARVAGKDATEEIAKLETALQSLDRTTATSAELSRYLIQVDTALKYIKSDADSAEKLDDVFNTITKYAEPARKANTDLKKEMRSVGDEAEKSSDKIKNATETITPEIKQVDVAVKQARTEIASIDTVMRFDRANNNIVELTQRLDALKGATKALKKDAELSPESLASYNRGQELIRQLTTQIQAYKEKSKEAKSATDKTASATKKAGEHSKTFGKNAKSGADMAKKAFQKLSSVVKVIKDGFSRLSGVAGKIQSSFGGMTHSMRGDFKHLLTSLTKYVFGFRSLFFLVRRLRKYLGEGIQNLVQFNGGVNDVNYAITNMLSSLLYLKNAWAAAFSPVITIANQILPALIDRMAEAGNMVARFIGVLTGQEVVFNAVKVDAADYAQGLDDVGGSASGAADKVKKLTDRLAAFDDLNVLGVDKDPDDTGSGGGGGSADAYTPNPNDMFTIVNAYSRLAEMIKTAISSGLNFTAVGREITDNIVNALTNINWDTIKEKAKSVGFGIRTFFTGLFHDPALFTGIGNTIAELLNTATSFVSGFFEDSFLEKMGEALGAEQQQSGGNLLALFINQLFHDIDWDSINKNILSFVDTFTSNFVDFFGNIDRNQIKRAALSFGYVLGETLNSTIGDAEFMGTIGSTIAGAINNIYAAFNNFFDTVNPEEIGNGIAELIRRAIEDVDWEEVGRSISLSASKIFNTLAKVFEETPADELNQAIQDFFAGIDWEDVFSALARLIIASQDSALSVAVAITDAINTVVSDPAFADTMTSLFSAIFETLDITKLSEALTTVTIAIFETLLATEGLMENIIIGFVQALTDHINSMTEDDWKDLAHAIADIAGGPILAGLKEGINKGFDDEGGVEEWVKLLLFGPIVWAFCRLFDIHSPSGVMEGYGKNLIEGLKNGIDALIPDVEGIFTTFKSNLETTWYNIRTNAVTNFWTMKSKIVEAFNAIKDGVKGPINGILSVVESLVNGIISGINSMVDKLNTMPDFTVTNPFNGNQYTLGIDLPRLNSVSIPRLAQGAVIPPNKEFMAVLGDQSHGTNIEAPLDTIKQAVAEVMANNGNAEMIALLQQLITVVENKNLTIGDKEIGKANARYNKQQNIIRGTSF